MLQTAAQSILQLKVSRINSPILPPKAFYSLCQEQLRGSPWGPRQLHPAPETREAATNGKLRMDKPTSWGNPPCADIK